MANPIQLFDALNAVIPLKRFIFGDGEASTAPVLHGPDGSPILTSSNPAHVRSAGSTGFDRSANAAAVPASSVTPLLTIAANPNRLNVEIQNQSANQLQVVRDNGSGGQATSILLTGVGDGQQGGGYSSENFKGRLRVYGPADSQVSAYED